LRWKTLMQQIWIWFNIWEIIQVNKFIWWHGDSTWTLELEFGCLEVEMTMVVRDGETSKRNSWTWKDILRESTLKKGMARQGCSKESRVGEALLQNVGAIHYSSFTRLVNSLFFYWSPFTRLVNSLLFHWSPFITTSEFTQNLVKSLGVQGRLLL
jgi:hypothetical protein